MSDSNSDYELLSDSESESFSDSSSMSFITDDDMDDEETIILFNEMKGIIGELRRPKIDKEDLSSVTSVEKHQGNADD